MFIILALSVYIGLQAFRSFRSSAYYFHSLWVRLMSLHIAVANQLLADKTIDVLSSPQLSCVFHAVVRFQHYNWQYSVS